MRNFQNLKSVDKYSKFIVQKFPSTYIGKCSEKDNELSVVF